METLKIYSYYKTPAGFKERENVHFYFSGVYLHGEVERLCNYDICYPANAEDFPGSVREVTTHCTNRDITEKCMFLDGVFPCIVDGKYECTAFIWYDEEYHHTPYWIRGLIVLNTDTRSMEYARKEYAERSLSL